MSDAAREWRRFDIAKMVLLVAVAVMVLAALAGLYWIAAIGQDQRQRLIDCTTPGHSCYDTAQRQQAAVIGNPQAPINDVAVIAAACGAAHPGDVPATRACVDKELAK